MKKITTLLLKRLGKTVIPPVFAQTPAEEWVLALAAIYTYPHENILVSDPRLFASLHEKERTQRDRKHIQRKLSELWDITGDVSAGQQITFLLETGHEFEYEGLKHFIDEPEFAQKNEEQKRQILRTALEEQKQEAPVEFNAMGELLAAPTSSEVLEEEILYFLKKTNFIQAHHAVLEKQGIIAWDLVRIVFLAKQCYAAGYLTAGQSWQHAFQAAHLLQDTFSNWQEMSENFLLGMEYWLAGDLTHEPSIQKKCDNELLDFRHRHHFLIQKKESPWNILPWKLRL